jgi:formate dehydrogenase iron-sulfur subunit
MDVIDRLLQEPDNSAQVALLKDLCDVMKSGSLCALGGFVPYPVMSALQHFPEDFRQPC